MKESLQNKTLKGMIWNFTESFSLQGVQFFIGILMARVLSPSDYGMIGMLAVFIAVSQSFIDSGFTKALIRKVNRTDLDFSTVFYFNIVISFIFYILLFFLAPYISTFYKTPILEKLIKVVAIPLVINSLFAIQQTRFLIEMDFKTQAKISFLSSVVTGISGIILAYRGFGVWALAYSGVIGAIVRASLYWMNSRWIPKWNFSMKSLQEMFFFGSNLLVSGLLDTIYKNIYPIVIGKKFASIDLGYYSRADGYSQLPATTIAGIMGRVTFPMLCQINNDNERLRRVYRQMIRLSAFIVFPLMIGLAILARPLILVMITDKWEPSIIMLQILCLALMWYPIHGLNLNLLQVKGRSDLFLRLEVLKKILGVLILCISSPFGIIYMCIGQVVSSLLCLIINTYYTGVLIHVGLWCQMRDLFPILCYCLMMAIVVWGGTFMLSSNFLKY